MTQPIAFGNGDILSAVEIDGKIKIYLVSGKKIIEREYNAGSDTFTAKNDIVVSLGQNYSRCSDFAVELIGGRIQNARIT